MNFQHLTIPRVMVLLKQGLNLLRTFYANANKQAVTQIRCFMNGGMYPVLMVAAPPSYFSVNDNVLPSPCSHLKIIPLIFAMQHLLKTSYIPYLSNSMIYIKSLCLLYIPAKLFSFKIQNHLYGILLGPFYLFGRTSYYITLRLLIAAAYQLRNTSSRTITEVKQR